MNGQYIIDDYGYFALSKEEKYLSDGGKCCVVEYEYQEVAIYFFSYHGMLGDSRGYLYVVDTYNEALIDQASHRFDFIDLKHIEGNWYSCKTSE